MQRHLGMGGVLAIVVGLGCSEAPPEISGGSTGATTAPEGSGTASPEGSDTAASSTTASDSASGADTTGAGSGSASSGDGLGSTTSSGSTAAMEDSGASSDGTTGDPSPVGCADGFRDALLDEGLYPDIAACAGGFWVPGVDLATPACARQGGDDGPIPDGMGCTIDDLCAEGWHLCVSRVEVMAAGLAGCEGQAWGGQFFATAQSGRGANACDATGTNDVFGCGDIGYAAISGCAPLNRSTGNLCVELAGPWSCDVDAYDEVSHLVKPGPDFGGALCCRDGV